MAMLAESRRRVRWTLNPRGNLWSDDDSKFGQKLMEKMGWSKGKGLGKDEQGRKDHVKVSVREGNKGIGYKGKDDEWIKHYDAFESVLANLNSANNSDEDSKLSDSVEEDYAHGRTSLEVKSKRSRARVHYHKFTRGKDLSRYGEDDLACILGSKMSKAPKTENGEVSQELEPEEEVEDEIGSTQHTYGVTTIKGGNIQEYFAKKMALLKKTDNCSEATNGSHWKEEEEKDDGRPMFGDFNSGFGALPAASNCAGLGWNQEKSEGLGTNRKKEKFREMNGNCYIEGAQEVLTVNGEVEQTHNKKKRKRIKEDEETGIYNGDDNGKGTKSKDFEAVHVRIGENGDLKEDILCQEDSSYVSKKKKKKKKDKGLDCKISEDEGYIKEMGETLKKKKKKKKNKNEHGHDKEQQGKMCDEMNLHKENHEELKENKKKKLKLLVEEEFSHQSSVENQEPTFTKKRKKNMYQDVNGEQDCRKVTGEQEQEKEELGQDKKKKKKKKKKERDTDVILEDGEQEDD